jgi:tetraacyldisaccharide 4'-kinase
VIEDRKINAFRNGAAALYGLAIKARSAGYRLGFLPVAEVEGIRVVSVGNLRSGGSGKTPFAMWLARWFQDRGVQTALLLRGYRGSLESSGGLVSLGRGPLLSADEAGDEAYLAAVRLEGVQVWCGSDRRVNARRAFESGARMVVLDDGFQHRRLGRDLEILLACPEDLDPGTPLLPAAPLREPPGSAARADLVGGFAADWEGADSPPPLLFAHEPTCFVARGADGLFSAVALTRYQGARAYLISGIGRPERVSKTAAAAGLEVVGEVVYPDHHPVTAREMLAASAQAKRLGAELLVTTEKNLVRMSDTSPGLPLLALRIDVRLVSGAGKLERLLEHLLPGTQAIDTSWNG